MRKWLGMAVAGLVALACAAGAQAETKYALCVGINKYTLSGCSTLSGCVNDSAYFYTNLVQRGGWLPANMTKLNDSKATKTAIRQAISNYAAKAQSGDVFIYQHSSHGDSGLLCTYNAEYKKAELATDLRSFASGVKVVIVVDACYSGSLFKSRAARRAYLDSWDFAGEVSREMDAQQAEAVARGVKGADKALTSSEIGWVTAASDSETSIDFGYYDTDKWLTDPNYESGSVISGTFLGSATWGWWKGTGDTSSVGDKDGYCDPLEFWKTGYDFCTKLDEFWGESDYSYTPQHTNDTVLKSVELGWVGDEEPSGVRFASIPDQTATVGQALSYTVVATNSDESTGAIRYSVSSSTAPVGSYSVNATSGAFSFTPAADGTFTFAFVGTNSTAHTAGTASMTVVATLAAPSGLANSGVASDSFTANWSAVPGAVSYVLEVVAADASASAASKATDSAFELVTDADGLTPGDYVILAENADRAMNNTCSGPSSGYLSYTDIEVEGSSVATDDASIIWTLDGDAESCTLFNAAAGMYANPATSKSVGWSAEASGAWTLSLSDGIVSAANAADTSWVLQYNASSPRFLCYSSKQKLLRFFRRDGASSAVFSGDVGNVTSYTVTGLIPGDYTWRVRAIGKAKGPFSETKDVTLVADPTAPPSFRAIDDAEIDVGETFTVAVSVSAPEEAPVTSLAITSGDAAATLEDSLFTFAPAAPGSYAFTLTAVNDNGSATVSFTVTASLAEPETPETPTEVASDSFTAVWEPVPGAESYELDVVQGATSGGGSGGGSVVLAEDFSKVATSNSTVISDFDAVTQTAGWSGETVYPAKGLVRLGKSAGAGSLQTPALEVSGSVTVEWSAYSWPNDSTTVNIGVSVDGGDTFTETAVALTESMAAYTTTFPVSGSSAIVRWASSASSKQRFYLDDITVSSGAAKTRELSGTHVEGFPMNVGNVTSYEVAGLQPNTEYTFSFRAIAGEEATDWSEAVSVTTTDGPSAPAWSSIPAQNTYVGATFQLDLSAYLSGSPTPTVTADVGTVTGLNYVYEAGETGSVTVTLTAANDSGTDTVSFVLAVAEPPVGGNHLAVLVGCNKYDSSYVSNPLNGCVPDANNIYDVITTRGDWEAANVTKLTDSAAKHSAIRAAIRSAASNAVPGDTFLYFHSSHGGNYNTSFVTNTALYTDYPILVYSVDPEGVDNCICSYDADYTAAELAADLAAFDPAVNIVVMLDTCHSAGMFKYDASPVSSRVVRRNAAGKALHSADSAFFAEAVNGQLGAIRRARGLRAASNVGFVTAADFDEYSWDSSEGGDGGAFTTAFVQGVTNGLCDGADYGDQDGWASFYEGWNYAKDIAVGCAEGEEVDDGVYVDANGYALYDNTYYAAYYDEPEYYYDYYFTHPQITNEAVLRAVRVGYAGELTLDAPVANAAADVTDSSFTASWSAVADATGYRLQVATDESFSTGAASDTLAADDLAATSTTYADFSGVSKDSGAVYAGKTAKNSAGAIQLNATTTTGSGIWTTGSGGNATRVAVEWNSATTTTKPRSIQVYGSDSALGSYDAVKAATLVGSITYGTDTELALDGSYAYVGLLASGGALYLDSVTVDWGTAGSESSIVLDENVGNVTAIEVTGLEAETGYFYRVQALGDPVDSDFSNVIALTTEAGTPTAPAWGYIPEQAAVLGQEFGIDLSAFVSGSPAPAITVDGVEAPGGVFTFTPDAEGPRTFALVASNELGTADATLTVVATEAPVIVTVPELTLSNPTADSFDADWTACTGATAYQFQVATDDQFTGGGGDGSVLTETFANATFSAPGSSYKDQTITECDLGTWTATECRADKGTPVIRAAGTLASPSIEGGVASVEFDYEWPFSESGSCAIDLYVNGTKVDSATVTGGTAGTASYTAFDAVSGSAVVELRNTGSSNKRMQVTQVRITSATKSVAKDGGSLVLEETVTGLSYTVTGLDPETTYYARVKGGADWSDVQSIATLAGDPSAPAKYALCVGVNEYDFKAYEAMGYELTPLRGTVNDATTMRDNLVARGGWTEANATLLTDEAATEDAVRSAMAGFAARAKAGDTFVYQHSSHGLGPESEDDTDADIALGLYDNLYSAEDFAEDLAAFPAGAKVVVLIDACHSAGMFKHGSRTATRSAAFDIAARVSAIMDARRAARRARGEDVSRSLSSEEIGWVTAADIYETSRDGGYYDTEEWMEDDDAEGEVTGAYFLASFTWGWWTGKADVSGTGDGDGWFDAYEGWSYSLPVCEEGGHHPQFLHEDVLRSVELGWIGDAAPSAAITFDPVPGATVGIGEEALLEGIAARNADGTSDGIVLSVLAAPEGAEYTFENGTLTFTPDEDGLFLFTIQAANADAGTTATKLLGVTAVLPAPVALDATDLADNSFTANWQAVDAPLFAYQLQVSTDPAFPAPEPEMVLDEGFDGVTNKASLEDKAWTFTGTFGTYTSSAYCGEDAPSIKFSSGTSVLTSPNFRLSGEAAIRFWTRGNGSNVTSTLKVELLVDGEWTDLDTFVPSPDGEQKEYDAIDVAAKQLRFTCTKNVGNVALDDVQLLCLPASTAMALDTDEIDPEATSFPVEDLVPGTTYYYRLRAIANTRSAWSETIEVTTTGEAPLPVPEVGLYAPLTDADTSIGAIMLGADGLQVRVQVATDETFADPVHDETTTASFLLVTGLAPETTYYVRACVIDGDRAGDWSDIQTITTAAAEPGPQPSAAAITDMTIADGQMTITFEGEGAQVLFSTDLVDWTPVEGATSPYTFDMGDGPGYIGVR